MGEIRAANLIELQFNILANDKLQEISKEIKSEEFWEMSPEDRFYRYNKMYSLFTELTNYHSFKVFIKNEIETSDVDEIKIQGKFYKFIRHLFAHFPYFDKWDDVWISKELISWDQNRERQFIHTFLTEFVGHKPMNFRFKSDSNHEFANVTLNFPQSFNETEKIYLKDIVTEKEGVLFSRVAMNTMLKGLNNQPLSE